MPEWFSYLLSAGAVYLWLGVVLVFGATEAATLSLTSIWFSFGALPAMIAATFGAPFGVQFALFIVCSLLLLIFTKPIVKKFMRREKTNVDAVVGQQVLVTTDIQNDQSTGEVKIGGLLWTARSADGDPISKGEHVRVIAVEGVKVIVSR